jgi:poly(3-hydroxybutyrate) depolymerase
MYWLFQAQEDFLAQFRSIVLGTADLLQKWDIGHPATLPLTQTSLSLRLLEIAGTTHQKPSFMLNPVRIDGQLAEVQEEVILTTPFCTLRRFAKDVADPGPRVLVVAPMSGHFATRLRGTLAALLPEHDVHVTDWIDARDIPASAGPFGLDDMIAHVMTCLEALGPGAHALSISQSAVAALGAMMGPG